MLFWPWWMGAGALAAVTLTYWMLVGKPLGVSASWARVLGAGNDANDEAFARDAAQNPDALAAALAAATLAEFPELAGTAEASAPATPVAPPLSLLARSTHVVFLVSLGVGGLLATLVSPAGFQVRTSLGSSFESLFHSGWSQAAGLFVGGVLVGFGTRMSAGCTSGHGLSGVSRLQMGSLIATATFFGTGVLTATLLHRVMS